MSINLLALDPTTRTATSAASPPRPALRYTESQVRSVGLPWPPRKQQPQRIGIPCGLDFDDLFGRVRSSLSRALDSRPAESAHPS